MAVELYPYNQETYAKILSMFESSNRVGVVQPTGTGKSFLFLKWMEDHPRDSFVVLSPSTEIFTQLQEYAEDVGNPQMLDEIQMISYQSLLRMTDEEIAGVQASKMVLDEFHRTGAEQWGPAIYKLLQANPNTQVLGGSATPVRYLDGARDMAFELFDRNLAVEMTLGEAVRKGHLPTPKYVPVWYDIDDKLSNNKEDCKEREETLAILKRKLEKSFGAEKIFQKRMPHDHGKLIVFCRDRKHLEEMQIVVPQWFSRVNDKVRCYVSISAQEDKDLQLQAFKDDAGEDAIKLLFTIDRLNEGVHVKGIDGVIMLRPTVSPIIYLQQMGRALASGSKSPLIFDVVNNYQNVQVPFGSGETRNVFEVELRDVVSCDVEVDDFGIFDEMMEFSSLVQQLDDVLYPSHDEIWERYLAAYVTYKREHGEEPNWKTIYNGENLGIWCNNQRRLFKLGVLSDERIKKLQAEGFIFDIFDAAWEYNLTNYVRYTKEYGNEPGQNTIYNGVNLGMWCGTQRQKFKNGTLSAAKIERLQSNGFVFDVFDGLWEQGFACAREYFEEHGNLNIPCHFKTTSGKNLCSWIRRQRTDYKNGKLSIERQKQLEAIGMVWDVYDAYWEQMFFCALTYFEQHGNLNVSRCFKTASDETLGVWVGVQRRAYKKGKLSLERQKRLEAIGMIWDPKDAAWNELFACAQSYFEENGNLKVPSDYIYAPDKKLGTWIVARRMDYKNGKLSIERQKHLEAIGMVWDVLDDDWELKFNFYVEYKLKFGKEPVQRTFYCGINLGRWCGIQRQNFKKGLLSVDRFKKLQDAGFPF